MIYHRLVPYDGDSFFLLHHFDRGIKKLVTNEQYAGLECAKCKKIDEYAALRLGELGGFSLNRHRDIVYTEDNMYCVSSKVGKVVEAYNIQGLEFIPILNSNGYCAVIPATAAVDVDKAVKFGLKRLGLCRLCGRFRETVGHVPLNALTVPSDPMCIFEPEVKLEGRGGIRSDLWISDQVLKILRTEGITGFYPDKTIWQEDPT